MNAIHEKFADGKLVCRAEHQLPDEVAATISDKLLPGRWMIEFYENNSVEDAKFCRTRTANLPEDAIMLGSKNGIIIAFPAPKY